MDRLYIKVRHLNWGFYFAHLERLNEEAWFTGDLVQLCMHLADKLPPMRVGPTVSVHDGKTGSALPQPLQWAAHQITKWKTGPAADIQLVCFFPLHLRNNHFALLEINEFDEQIYCYDTGGYDTKDVQVRLFICSANSVLTISQTACKTEFPHLQFREQVRPPAREMSATY